VVPAGYFPVRRAQSRFLAQIDESTTLGEESARMELTA
jgi:hypothetical protein